MLFHLRGYHNFRMFLKIKNWLIKFKNWIIFTVLGIGVAMAAGQVLPETPSIAKEKMAIAYEQSSIKAKYKMQNASFIMEAIDENAMQTEIGDKTADKFSPEMTLRKWNDEVNFKIKYKHNEKEKDLKFELDGEKIKMKGKKIETHFYEVENGYEFEIILLEKPDTNIVNFDIETKGLNFYYQPALTIEDNPDADYCTDTICFKEIDGQIATTTHRPIEIVGSYAVYHESKTGDYSKMGGKNYMAGKFDHIYKPQIIDSNGWKVWGKLNITGNLLTVEIPQEFLDNAVYPVKHAAGLEFGYHTNGQSTIGSSNYYAQACMDAPAGTGNVSKISAYLSTTNNLYIKGVLWLQSNGNIITNGITLANIDAGSGLDWYDFDYSTQPEVSNGVNYYIGYITRYGGRTLYYDTGDAGDGGYDSNNYSTPEAFDNPQQTTNKYSIYCTYTAGGAEDTCTYSSGDWDVLESDNCYITSDVYVNGKFNLIGGATGQFGCADGVKVSAENFNFGGGTTFDMGCFAHH